MIWPFKRKPKVVDRREPNNWRPGDKAICIADTWSKRGPCDPEVGDVFTVTSVEDGLANGGTLRAYWLRFKAIPAFRYESCAFRKLVEQDDAALIARLKSLHREDSSLFSRGDGRG